MPVSGSRLASGSPPPTSHPASRRQQPMAVSLGSLGNQHSTSGGAYYVPAWRYLHQQRQQQQHGHRVHPHSPPSPPPAPPTPTPGSISAADQMFSVSKSRLPTDMPRDPRLWSREDVRKWLQWCQDEFDLPHIDVNQFPMNGKALCLLMKPDFNDRAPRAGDVLYNAVHLLLLNASMSDESHQQRYDRQLQMYSYTGGGRSAVRNVAEPSSSPHWATAWPFVSSDYHSAGQLIQQQQQHSRFDPHSNGGGVDSTVTLSPAPSTDSQSGSSPRHEEMLAGVGRCEDDSPIDLGRHHTASANNSESGESDSGCRTPVPISLTKIKQAHIPRSSEVIPSENVTSVMEQPVTNGRLLWDFLHQLLNDAGQRYGQCIAWKERDTGVFKIVDPHGLAQLWGMQKNHLNMNFDKMSRALRYYYRVNILKKVQGERHCYQFLRQPMELKACKQRALLNKYCGIQANKVTDQSARATPIKCEQENV